MIPPIYTFDDVRRTLRLRREPDYHEIAVKARIHTLGGYSAHAGRCELLRWAASVRGRPRFVLVHGEPEALEALRDGLLERHGIRAETPRYGERIVL